MREPYRDPGRLEDILEAAKNVAEFIESVNFQQSYMLSLDYKDKHPEIPWNSIIRMRHVLVHGYAEVLPEILWTTATSDVPVLRHQVELLITQDLDHNS